MAAILDDTKSRLRTVLMQLQRVFDRTDPILTAMDNVDGHFHLCHLAQQIRPVIALHVFVDGEIEKQPRNGQHRARISVTGGDQLQRRVFRQRIDVSQRMNRRAASIAVASSCDSSLS